MPGVRSPFPAWQVEGHEDVGDLGDEHVRDLPALQKFVHQAVERFDRLDVVVASAGILSFGRTWELDEESWSKMIGVNERRYVAAASYVDGGTTGR